MVRRYKADGHIAAGICRSVHSSRIRRSRRQSDWVTTAGGRAPSEGQSALEAALHLTRPVGRVGLVRTRPSCYIRGLRPIAGRGTPHAVVAELVDALA